MSFYELKITGKDVKRFIHNLHKMHINILNIDFEEKVAVIKVSKLDYKKIKQIKTIYQIEIIRLYGIEKIKQFIQKYFLFFIMLGMGFFFLLGLTNIIFEIEVIHNNKNLRELIIEELKEQGIQKYHFVVSYQQKEKIKQNILTKYRDKIEWIEIERQGTRYEVKIQERKKSISQEEEIPQDIIAKKNGIITKIVSSNGEIVAKKDQYVKKGDILISGTIHKKDDIVGYVNAKGSVLAETWYTVTVELPYHYHEEKILSHKQYFLELDWFHYQKKYFRFAKYEKSKKKPIYQLKHSGFPIALTIEQEQELEIIDKIYTRENALLTASEIAKEKLAAKLEDNMEILYEKNLKIAEENSKIIIVMFYKVLEDITDYQKIIIEEPNKE